MNIQTLLAEYLTGNSLVVRPPTFAESGVTYSLELRSEGVLNLVGSSVLINGASPSGLALGETSTTAYRGDRGKIAYDVSQILTGFSAGFITADGSGGFVRIVGGMIGIQLVQYDFAEEVLDELGGTTVGKELFAITNNAALKAKLIADCDMATEAYADSLIASLVAASPATLDTLDEIAAALGDDPNFAATITTSLGNRLRVDTSTQGLSSQEKLNARTNIGLENVPNVDATNPANITEDATHRFATDTEKTAWNAKQSALGYTPLNPANNLSELSNIVIAKTNLRTWIHVAATADQSVTSNQGLTNSTYLTFTIPTGKRYAFKFVVFFNTPAAADFRYDLDASGVPTVFRYYKHGIANGNTAFSGIGVDTADVVLNTIAGNGTDGGVMMEGFLYNNTGSSMTLTFRFGQNTSNAGATTILPGSFVEYLDVTT